MRRWRVGITDAESHGDSAGFYIERRLDFFVRFFNKHFSIIIESKELAEAIKNIFDIGWEEVKRLNKNLVKKRANDGAKTKRVLC